jgi:hypothetical protein
MAVSSQMKIGLNLSGAFFTEFLQPQRLIASGLLWQAEYRLFGYIRGYIHEIIVAGLAMRGKVTTQTIRLSNRNRR